MRLGKPIFVKPEVYLLEDLISDLSVGGLRIPRFQRPFVWRPEQMCDLFDSVEKSYPIGSILIWETDEPLASLDVVGDITVGERTSSVAYVLDGHQRLSTLFGCLWRRDEPGPNNWPWTVYRDLSLSGPDSVRYAHWKHNSEPPPSFFPVRSALRTMDFLAYARQLQDRVSHEEHKRLVDAAERVSSSLRSYKIAVVRLVGGDLTQAVEVFSRLNSRGSAMTAEQMVSALTYRDGDSDSLGERIASIAEGVAASGFGELDPTTVFRIVLVAAGESDIQAARWEVLANRIVGVLEDAVERAAEALQSAIGFFRSRLNAANVRLIPYQLQLILTSAAFLENASLSEAHLDILESWCWRTSWAGWFAGSNSTEVKNAVLQMRRFAASATPDPTMLSIDQMVPLPFPRRFDMRSARVRIFMLWDTGFRAPERPEWNGDDLPAAAILEDRDAGYRHIFNNVPKELLSSPANRVLLRTPIGISAKSVIRERGLAGDVHWLTSHAIPSAAFTALQLGDEAGFVRQRADYLEALELEFMRSMGVVVDPEATITLPPEVDTADDA